MKLSITQMKVPGYRQENSPLDKLESFIKSKTYKTFCHFPRPRDKLPSKGFQNLLQKDLLELTKHNDRNE